MRNFVAFVAWTTVALAAILSARAQPNPFNEHVRSTAPLDPAAAQKAFTLPPGFEIQLVAAEPDIYKPMNLAFDARGRLWVTDSTEYPFPQPLDQPARDTLRVLSDFGPDGRARSIVTFADGLNIPIGVYPLPRGDEALVFSIPHIWRMKDTTGDGRADVRERLYGPMGWQRDTHGLNNAFTRGFDGWLYACHGFNNETRFAGADGHEVAMQSGNTYRMRLDGSRAEQFTWGQVNPFGMAINEWGDLFTADCHSKPLYQLLRGGYYPSFGKPHDGLGFTPQMMNHSHGSTAICGVAWLADTHFPAEYRENTFSGNVMTSRVNRNRIVARGSTFVAEELPDFVTTSDPWFRPVDIQLGPDGALYIADFYNRIIGHYEVPLNHPGRDRHRGRIWRVVYTGDDPACRPLTPPLDLTTATAEQLAGELSHPNLTQRLLATNYLADEGDDTALAAVERVAGDSQASAHARSHALWVLERRGRMGAKQLLAAVDDADPLVRLHAVRIYAERPHGVGQPTFSVAEARLADADPFVRRAAADWLAQHPAPGQIWALLAALEQANPADDSFLHHGLRIALRNQLRAGALPNNLLSSLSAADARRLADISLAAPSEAGAAAITAYLERDDAQLDRLADYLQHAARHGAVAATPTLVARAKQRHAGDLDRQLELLAAIRTGHEQRGLPIDDALRAWAVELVGDVFRSSDGPEIGWTCLPLEDDAPHAPDMFAVQQRASADGNQQAAFFSSLSRGEQMVGVYRSGAFTLPPRLTFFCAGHNGPTNQPPHGKNRVRLLDAATGAVLHEAPPPRNDVAQRIEWNLAPHAGKQGYLEIVDGDRAGGFAWLAVGRFSLPELNPSQRAVRRQSALQLVARLNLAELRPQLVERVRSAEQGARAQADAAAALAALDGDAVAAALAIVLAESPDADQRQMFAEAIAARADADARRAALEAALLAAAERTQQLLAEELAARPDTAQLLVSQIEAGRASPRLLRRPALAQKLAALRIDGLAERIARLTAGLPSVDETVGKLLAQRKAEFQAGAFSAATGAAVYKKHCLACHKIGDEGALIGPQLDGIGGRGLDRILEDVLDPNRNVDVAFRTTTLALADGRVVSGLFRREEGELLVLADDKGKEFTVPKSQVEEQQKTALSLMPAGWGETIPPDEFGHLLAYLLDQRAPRGE